MDILTKKRQMPPQNFLDRAPFTPGQQAWLEGYLAGFQSRLAENERGQQAAPLRVVNVFYGTQTGNSESIAEDIAQSAPAYGLAADIAPLDEVSIDALKGMERVLIICSTYGEGEMPDNAELFWEAIRTPDAPRLESTHFSVLALGDTSYDGFCEAGKLIDLRLEQLGARRIADRVDCDVDYEDDAAGWIEQVLPEIGKYGEEAPAAGVPVTGEKARTGKAVSTRSKWNRKNPYLSLLQESRRLSGPGSAKEIMHYEFALGDSGMDYETGDALGVIPLNAPALVSDLIEQLEASPETDIDERPLELALTRDFEISTPNRDFLRELANRAGDAELTRLISNSDKEQIDDFLWSKDTLDLLRLYPEAKFSAAEFVTLLKPLQHRAYSISSSPKAAPDSIHLTVATVQYASHGRDHRGVCSGFLRARGETADHAGIFVQPNKSYRVPEDPDTPMIMVGPGTGIAPFRAFLQEREAAGAKGRNWLFFGDQHAEHDYIYHEEMDGWQKSGHLTRLDLAFSRDQAEKIYVQTRMQENAKELYGWLEDGGYFYVCGDATRMARDVDRSLIAIIAKQSGKGPEFAEDYVNELKRQKRYLRDVY